MTAIEHKGVCYVGSDFATTAALIEPPAGLSHDRPHANRPAVFLRRPGTA